MCAEKTVLRVNRRVDVAAFHILHKRIHDRWRRERLDAGLRWAWVVEVHVAGDLHPLAKQRQLHASKLVALAAEADDAALAHVERRIAVSPPVPLQDLVAVLRKALSLLGLLNVHGR